MEMVILPNLINNFCKKKHMKFKINDSVKILKTNSLKTIVDCEQISDINIYYMSDITSYSENELCEISVEDEFNHILEKRLYDRFYFIPIGFTFQILHQCPNKFSHA